MDANNRTQYPYKHVRRDLLDAITGQFAPARQNAALLAAAKALKALSDEERKQLACDAEREYAGALSDVALKRFHSGRAAVPDTTV
jgi:hypothetical protein